MENLKQFTLMVGNDTYYKGRIYYAPRQCPHCSQYISVSIVNMHRFDYSDELHLNLLLHLCPDCDKRFVTTHLRDRKLHTNKFVSSYPSFVKHPHSKVIEDFSPRFVSVFNQAHIAEQMNHLTLAGMGYRAALEILIKDFAINEHPEDTEKIKDYGLYECTQKYYKDLESSVSAHVVRRLGNDYAHYVQEFEDIDFSEIKYFLNIFILNIEMKLKIKNPPVPTPQT